MADFSQMENVLILNVILNISTKFQHLSYITKKYMAHNPRIGLWTGFTKPSSELIQRALGFVEFPYYAVIWLTILDQAYFGK